MMKLNVICTQLTNNNKCSCHHQPFFAFSVTDLPFAQVKREIRVVTSKTAQLYETFNKVTPNDVYLLKEFRCFFFLLLSH